MKTEPPRLNSTHAKEGVRVGHLDASQPPRIRLRAARLPEPMLVKSGRLPDGLEWRFELKLDGFRAIVSTTGGLRVRSHRRWNMTALVPELADLPPRLTLDGELIAFGEDKL